jgi:transmembrane sensor
MTSERGRIRRDGSTSEPLGSLLSDDLPEARVQQMWQRIDHAPARHSGLWLTLATAAAVALLLLGATRWLVPPQGSGQLRLASGNVPAVLGASDEVAAPQFDDGSRMSLQRGARVEVLRNDARSFVTALRRGVVTFDVKPGGKRHWVVEAGDVSVEVVGTRFRVERQPAATRVSVEHGVVLVRGERVTGGSVRLTAGQSFELLPLPAPPLPPTPAPTSPVERAAPEPSSATLGPVPNVPSSARVAAPTVDPVARELAQADDARRRGDSASAARHFEAAWSSAPAGDARRGLAALSLARLLGAGSPARTAQILRSSLQDMPPALREDAQARLVEAESRAGNQAGALRAAEEYRRRFPSGQRLHEVERWSEP